MGRIASNSVNTCKTMKTGFNEMQYYKTRLYSLSALIIKE